MLALLVNFLGNSASFKCKQKTQIKHLLVGQKMLK